MDLLKANITALAKAGVDLTVPNPTTSYLMAVERQRADDDKCEILYALTKMAKYTKLGVDFDYLLVGLMTKDNKGQ